MDNQQAKTVSLDLAWLAGFMDGEGSFMIIYQSGKAAKARFNDSGRLYMLPRIVLVNTDMPVLTEVERILTENELPYHISQRVHKVGNDGSTRKASWDIRVQGMKRCQKWCQVLIPYLRLKKDQAEVMLRLVEIRFNAAKGDLINNGYTEEEKSLIETLRRQPKSHRLHA